MDMSESPSVVEDMEEYPRKERQSYFNEPVYGPIPPSEPAQTWELSNGYDTQGQMVAAGYQGEWPDYQYPEKLTYPEQYLQQSVQEHDALAGTTMPQDPRFMTQEERD